MNQDELRNLMECYRADPEGLDDAEFAALREAAAADMEVREQLQAVQAWDAAISVAMHDVAVPDDLADRLLAAVEQAEHDSTGADLVAPVLPQRLPHQLPQRKRWWSRWPARAAAAAVTVAALVTVVIYVPIWTDTLTTAQVAQSARGWIVQLDDEGWQQTPPPEGWFDVQQVLNFPLDGWQDCTALNCSQLNSESVAFRATVPPARSRAWLFVIKTSKGRNLPDRPPSVPHSTTGNICVGVWKKGNHLYVLAVQGTQATYHRLVKTQTIAWVDAAQPAWLPGA